MNPREQQRPSLSRRERTERRHLTEAQDVNAPWIKWGSYPGRDLEDSRHRRSFWDSSCGADTNELPIQRHRVNANKANATVRPFVAHGSETTRRAHPTMGE